MLGLSLKKNYFIYLLQVMLFALLLSGCDIVSPKTEAVIKVSSTKVHVGESVNFDASASSGASGDIVSYTWKDEVNNLLNKNITFSDPFNQAGKHTITLVVVDSAGESSKTTVVIEVSSIDMTPPVITLKGSAHLTLEQGDTYIEPDASAADETDGVVSVAIQGTVDTSKAGTYTIVYSAKDKAGNTSQKSRVVEVVLSAETRAPVITLNGDTNITLNVADTYTELGASAKDDRDSNVSVNVNGAVDTSKAGTYTIVYSAKDKAGNTSQRQRVVIVIDKILIEKEIDKLEEKMNNPTVPYMTEVDLNNSKYADSNLTIAQRRESTRAHLLVATAKDPDSEWFNTKMEPNVILANAGDEYTVAVKKVRSDGSIIGNVDNSKLDIVVRIQNAKGDFSYITNVNIDKYALWDSSGKIKIHVPDDLSNGRVLVAVRPNFVDVSTKAIAQRWSALMSAEVWSKKDNVKTIDASSVLFPVEGALHIKTESKFTKSDIKSAFDEEYKKELLVLPLIVKDIVLKKDDLVSYVFEGKPYAGRVVFVDTKANQTLVLLAPEYTKVYNIVDINNTTTQEEGLVPKHVIYREGTRIDTDENETDPIEVKKMRKSKRSPRSLFDLECSQGKGMLTFEPKFTVYPFDVGVEFSFTSISTEVTCKLEAEPIRITYHPPLTAGGIAGVVGAILGTGFTMSSFGEEYITADALPSVGAKVEWSCKGGETHELFSPVGAFGLGSNELTDAASEGAFKAGTKLGMKYELNAISSDGLLGTIYSWFSDDIDFDNIGIEASVGSDGVFAVVASNAKSVEAGNDSEVGMEFGVKVEVKFSQTVDTLIKGLGGIDSLICTNETYDLFDSKYKLSFDYNSVIDSGQGVASLVGLHPKYGFISAALPSGIGVLSLKNSSVYNQKSNNINYSLDECAQSPGCKIASPAIGCAGWMRGVVSKEVLLCKGKFTISDTIASARVGKLASTKSTIVNNAGDIKVNISGSPLEPKTKILYMKAGTKSEVAFEKVCPNEPGVYRKKKYLGKSTVTAEGTNLSGEALNILACYKDKNKGDPHITTGDGLGYDYFASGDYILSRVLDADGDQVSGYEIQGRFLPGFKTSWPQAVALSVGGDRVEIQGRDFGYLGHTYDFNAFSVWVNGERIDGNNIIKLPSGGIIAITESKSDFGKKYPSSITVIWPEGSPTENYGLVVNVADAPNPPLIETLIARPDDFAGQERGLLGNNDGNPKNDFIRRNGEVLGVDHNMSFTELYVLFGADWLARPYESLFRNTEAIKPQFPTDVITLTPEQRALGEEACRALAGFYREACIMDAGLTGSAEIVKEYYANTEDLNDLCDAIVVPDVEKARYTMNVGDKSYEPDSGYYLHYKQDINISQTAGKGKFMLLVRPPRGATVMLGTGESSHRAEGSFSTTLEVDCTQQNSSTDSEFLQKDGAVQLWLQDPLSGTAQEMVSQEPLVCTDVSKRAGFSLHLGSREEKADSDDSNLHYTQALSIAHTNSYAGTYILELTPPSNSAVLTLNSSSAELNVTGSSDYNTSIELDCTQVVYDANYSNGSIKLWEKDKFSGQKAYLYSSSSLSCKKAKLLKTGQTTSYSDFDDGYYRIGEKRSYSRDDAKEIVTDNVTQLQWQDNAEAKTVCKTWQGAKRHCAALELGGYNDWRLPNRKELLSIVDHGRCNPSLDPEFLNFVSNYYWSSTTYAGNSGNAWGVYFYYGNQYGYIRAYSYYVRCVRAGE